MRPWIATGPGLVDDEFHYGGRQVASDVIEFYIKEPPIVFVRLDVWLNTWPTGRAEADLREYATSGQR